MKRYPLAVCGRPADEKCPMDDKTPPGRPVAVSDCLWGWCWWYRGGLEWWALG